MHTVRLTHQGHTVGNVLAQALQYDPRVVFAGYSLPAHAAVPVLELKLRLRPGYDPAEVLKDALQARFEEVDSLLTQFRDNLRATERSAPERRLVRGEKRKRQRQE